MFLFVWSWLHATIKNPVVFQVLPWQSIVDSHFLSLFSAFSKRASIVRNCCKLASQLRKGVVIRDHRREGSIALGIFMVFFGGMSWAQWDPIPLKFSHFRISEARDLQNKNTWYNDGFWEMDGNWMWHGSMMSMEQFYAHLKFCSLLPMLFYQRCFFL